MFFKEMETDGATVLVAGHLGSTSTCPGLPEAPLHALSALGSHRPCHPHVGVHPDTWVPRHLRESFCVCKAKEPLGAALPQGMLTTG